MMKNFGLKKKIGCAIVGIVILAGVILLSRPKESDATGFQAVFEEEQTREEATVGITDGIKIPGYQTISIAANQKEVSVNLENPDGNPCYFQISIYLKDTGELLYQSNLIKPGQHLYDIALEKEMSEGSYPITVQYDTFSLDDSFKPLNGATSTCTLVVG